MVNNRREERKERKDEEVPEGSEADTGRTEKKRGDHEGVSLKKVVCKGEEKEEEARELYGRR